MKRKMIVAIASGIISLLIFSSQAKVEETTTPSVAQNLSRFAVSVTGALTVVRNKQGEEIFGSKRPTNEGYAIAYQLVDSKTKKEIGEPQVIYGMGDRFPQDQAICKTCSDPRVATVISPDGAMMITSNFHFDAESETLRIVRFIENNSYDQVYSQRQVEIKLLSIRTQHDPNLASKQVSQFGVVKAIKRRELLIPPFAKGLVAGSTSAVQASCQWCPPDCDIPLSLTPGNQVLICVNCPSESETRTLVQRFNVLGGEGIQAAINRVRSNVKCEYPLVVEGWGAIGGLPPDVVRLRDNEIVCIDCPKEGEKKLSVRTIGVLLSGPNQAEVENSRKQGECQIAVRNTGSTRSIASSSKFSAATGTTEKTQFFNYSKNGQLPNSNLKPGQVVKVETVLSLRQLTNNR